MGWLISSNETRYGSRYWTPSVCWGRQAIMTNASREKTVEGSDPTKGARSKRKTGKTRDDRLKSALKANMAKRKSQARARNAAGDENK